MSWSKTRKGNYPIGWRYHKFWCELWYWFEQNIYHFFYFKFDIKLPMPKWCSYYYHLNKLCDYGFNLYGEKL